MGIFESVLSVQLSNSGITMSDAVAESMAMARLILNDDFLGVELAENAGLLPSHGEIPEMDIAILSQLQKNRGGWILMAMPPDVSLATIVTHNPLAFGKEEREEMETLPFARKADPRWRWVMIRKKALGWVPDTNTAQAFDKKLGSYPLPKGHDHPEGTSGGRDKYSFQKALLCANERVTYAREIAYAAVAYRRQTGLLLFKNEYVRCADTFIDAFGASQRACLGMSSKEGMSFRGFADNMECNHYHLGVARDVTRGAEKGSSK